MQDTYLGTKTRRGKLMQSFYSLTKKFKNSGLVQPRQNLKRLGQESIEKIDESKVAEDCKEDIEWLKNNNSPESIIIEKWNKSYEFRKIQLQTEIDLLKEWPILKQRIGKSLVSIKNGISKIH